MMFFRMSGLTTPSTPAERDEDELIEAQVFSLSDAREMVRRGEIIDMKTALGLTLV
jgi:hypothetical protein